MASRLRTGGLLLAALLAAPAFARAEARISPLAEAQLDEGLRRLYALDYEKSRAAFRRLVEHEPDNPWGYLFEAGGIWWQASLEYGLFKDTPTLQGLFEQDVEAAIRKSELYQDSKDKEQKAAGHFVEGMALGTRGQWTLMKGKYIGAYFDGKKAVKNLKKALKIDEDFIDAHLGLGVFDYQTAHLSGVARLGALFGVRGDEKRGLERLELASEKAKYSRRQALQFLSSIYLYDKKDFGAALPYIKRLREEFPDSPYFVFLELVIRRKLGDDALSLTLGRELHRMAEADPAAFRRKALTLACGLSGPDCLNETELGGALGWLELALADDAKAQKAGMKPSSYAAFLRILRAQALDAVGRREEAAEEYKRVQKLPPFDDSRERARYCLASPCTRQEILARLRSLSKGE